MQRVCGLRAYRPLRYCLEDHAHNRPVWVLSGPGEGNRTRSTSLEDRSRGLVGELRQRGKGHEAGERVLASGIQLHVVMSRFSGFRAADLRVCACLTGCRLHPQGAAAGSYAE